MAALALSKATRIPEPQHWLPNEPIRANHEIHTSKARPRPDSAEKSKSGNHPKVPQGPVPAPPPPVDYKIWRFPAGQAPPTRLGPPPQRPVSAPRVLERGHFHGQWNEAIWDETQYDIPFRMREMQIGVKRSLPWSHVLRKPGPPSVDLNAQRSYPQRPNSAGRAGVPTHSARGSQKPSRPNRPNTAPSRIRDMKQAIAATHAKRSGSTAAGTVIRAEKSLTSSSKTNNASQ